MVKKDFPTVHYFDQDFVDVYDQTWAWIHDHWHKGDSKNGLEPKFFHSPGTEAVNQFEAIFSTFFLVYSNRTYPAAAQLDLFYNKQEEDGAIRSDYRLTDGKPVLTKDNPEGVNPPLFAWAEYNLFHKVGNKKRVKEIMPVLEKYYTWLQDTFQQENGLYKVPAAATKMINSPRDGAEYYVDFNAQQALNAYYMAELGEILNDKEIAFRYKRLYFSLKTRINNLMWNESAGVYYDIDGEHNQIMVKTIATFWPMLCAIPNEARIERLIGHMRNPETFGTENPFPTLAADEPAYDPEGGGFCGSVFTPFTFMVIKALEQYKAFELAREFTIRHLYYLLDTLHPEGSDRGTIWEAYQPHKDGPAKWKDNPDFPRPMLLAYTSLATITLMIEHVIGLTISLPRKEVTWIIPTKEIMGIENLSLKRNNITILAKKSGRGWEIRLESEKLYYFTVDVLGEKLKTLPIPSGKCSMLLDKL
ncbi:MGH1-like glycoside hydrolase domain-containing protein [Spirochaeta africana]|uniref:Neutral trehalase n=1 Tax=Spirochaeta africana (strain ATCC 700263 / DSM 8902 / Z-7692) TaxID=889378 RepID=H9UMY5_SPIAZ|nr:trehalase family glycosidase [Spirochaeta africana]AFG38878.1 neutral trehalase [Spirochaeta africana DSM 8902]